MHDYRFLTQSSELWSCRCVPTIMGFLKALRILQAHFKIIKDLLLICGQDAHRAKKYWTGSFYLLLFHFRQDDDKNRPIKYDVRRHRMRKKFTTNDWIARGRHQRYAKIYNSTHHQPIVRRSSVTFLLNLILTKLYVEELQTANGRNESRRTVRVVREHTFLLTITPPVHSLVSTCAPLLLLSLDRRSFSPSLEGHHAAKTESSLNRFSSVPSLSCPALAS